MVDKTEVGGKAGKFLEGVAILESLTRSILELIPQGMYMSIF